MLIKFEICFQLYFFLTVTKFYLLIQEETPKIGIGKINDKHFASYNHNFYFASDSVIFQNVRHFLIINIA